MKNFFKPTMGIIIAWIVLLVLTIHLLLPAPYASIVSNYLGIFGNALAAITIILISPVIFLHDMLQHYLVIFFAIVLIYNYLFVCVIKKLFSKFNPNLRIFFIIYILLEIITYIVGSFFTWHAQCSACIIGTPCAPCPSGNYGIDVVLLGIIVNSVIAFILSIIARRLTHRT